MKCEINENLVVTKFWHDEDAPNEALEVTKYPAFVLDSSGEPTEALYLCNLVDGVVSPVDPEAYQASIAYSEARKRDYDKLNQFELISDDSINGTSTHKDAILAIKAKYSKPS